MENKQQLLNPKNWEDYLNLADDGGLTNEGKSNDIVYCIKRVLFGNEKSSESFEEIQTDHNCNVVSKFIEHCNEKGVKIPDKMFESYFNA